MKPMIDYTLYLVTDRKLMSAATIEESVEKAIAGGVTVVQLREKAASSLEFYETACRVKKITDCHQIPLIINDRLDIALAVDAAGVHVGQNDMPAKVVRRIMGCDKIVGVSVSTLEQAACAEKNEVDYIGVGALFKTLTKTDANEVSLDSLVDIRKNVSIPIVGIGGIHAETIPLLKHAALDGIAVVSAIIGQQDITQAAKELKALFISNR